MPLHITQKGVYNVATMSSSSLSANILAVTKRPNSLRPSEPMPLVVSLSKSASFASKPLKGILDISTVRGSGEGFSHEGS